MADTFDERFSGAPELVPGTEGTTFANPEVAKKYMAQYADQPVSVTGFAKYLGGFGSYLASQPAALLSYFGGALKQGVEQGARTEDYIGAAFDAATMELLPGGHGAQFKVPEGVLGAARDFHEQVTMPTAERAVANPGAVVPIMGSDVPASVPRSELAKTGNYHIDAVLDSPVTKDVIDNPTINRDYDVPYTAGGSVPLADRTTFIDRNFPKAISVEGKTFDPADPFALHENYEQHKMDLLVKGGMSDADAYTVAHWEAEQAEGAWYRAHGIDQAKAEAIYKPLLMGDQATPATKLPPNLYTRPYPHDAPMAAHNEPFEATQKPSPELQARANAITEKWLAEGALAPTPAPTPMVNPLQEARDLGVIGPERLPHPEDTPAQAAQRAIPASMKQDPNDKIIMTPDGKPIGDYQMRFAEWVSKIKHPGDIDNLIMQAAREENFFEQTRESREIPAAHIEELAKVTGFDSTKFDPKLLRTKFTTDAEFRMAAQIMFQARDDAIAGIERMRNAPSPENMDAAFETYNRFKVALRYTAAFRQDWGKSGHAQQEILDIEKRRVQYQDRERNGVPKPVNDLVAAVDDFGREPSKSGLDKLLGTIAAAEKELEPPKPPKEGEPRAQQPKPSPELTELVRTARAVADLMNVKRPEPSGVPSVRPLRQIVVPEREPMPKNALASFNRLLSQAERTAGEKQAAIQRAASKQLPPDLQDLVDKAEFVTKRFGGIERERAEAQVAAEATAGLDKEGFSYVLGKAFEMSKSIADHTDKLFWLRNNWLLSGPITHTFYFVVNAGTAVAKHILTPPVAALIDRVQGGRNVFFGEAGAGALGLVSGVPGAIRAGMTAARTGLRVPLEAELRLAERGEPSPQARGSNIPYLAHASPDWGALKTAADWLGVPMKARSAAELMAGGAFGRFANMQHTMFKVLGESAQAHRNAYVAAVKEGLNPLTDSTFADRYTYHLKNPTDEALIDNVNAGFEGTFMQKLGPKTQRFASALKDTPLRWEFPFMHVPLNITRMGVSYSPLAFFGSEMRAQLMGERGARSQATALAQVGIGTAALSYIMNMSLQGKATGDYPPDPKERKQRQALGIPNNSFQSGDEWVSFNRFGPARIPLTIGANLGDIIKNYDSTKATDEEMAKAVGSAIVATVHALSDEVGMLMMHNTLEAMNGARGMAQYGAGIAASFLPYNVGAGQIAAFTDPYARQAKSFMDNIKYRIPYLRETLPAKRDAVYGEPLPNPAYHSLIRSVPATPDPVKVELDRLGYHPNSPQAKIGPVQLTPQQYEKYEATAGQGVKRGLNELMYDPAYAGMTDDERGQQARAVVRYFRREARGAMQIDEPGITMDGRENRLQQINGP